MVGVKRGEQKEEDGEEEGKKGSGGNGGNGAGGGPIMRGKIGKEERRREERSEGRRREWSFGGDKPSEAFRGSKLGCS